MSVFNRASAPRLNRIPRDYAIVVGKSHSKIFHLGRALSVLTCLICLTFSGCQDEVEQAGRSPLNGAISYDGQPVPFGDIVFTPDGSKGNSGPEGFAIIQNGIYDTQGTRGKGVSGGPTTITVSAFRDGPGKGVIVEAEFALELPQQGGKFDIVIPKVDKPKPAPEINF